MDTDEFTRRVLAECQRVEILYGPARDEDEALSVLAEEVREIETEVYRRRREAADVACELVQIAACARRWAVDVLQFSAREYADYLTTALAYNGQANPSGLPYVPAQSHHGWLTRLHRHFEPLRQMALGLLEPDNSTVRRHRSCAALVYIHATCALWAQAMNLP